MGTPVIIAPPCPCCGHPMVFVGDVVACLICLPAAYSQMLEEVVNGNRN